MSGIPVSALTCLDAARAAASCRLLFEKGNIVLERAHTLKRRILSHYQPAAAPAEWRLDRRERGNPFVVQPFPYRFNLSHSGRAVAMAVADTEVGVDIERIRPIERMDGVAERVFHPQELEWLNRQPDTATSFFVHGR